MLMEWKDQQAFRAEFVWQNSRRLLLGYFELKNLGEHRRYRLK